MSQFTRQQRNKIYKRALSNYNNERWDVLCLCVGSDAGVSNDDVPEHFPEFAKFKPKVLISNNIYSGLWWPIEDRESRVRCLEACIAQTEGEEKKPWWKFW